MDSDYIRNRKHLLAARLQAKVATRLFVVDSDCYTPRQATVDGLHGSHSKLANCIFRPYFLHYAVEQPLWTCLRVGKWQRLQESFLNRSFERHPAIAGHPEDICHAIAVIEPNWDKKPRSAECLHSQCPLSYQSLQSSKSLRSSGYS